MNPSPAVITRVSPAGRFGRVQPAILLVFVVVAVAAAIWFWMQPGTQPNAESGRAVADSFLTHLREGRPDQAWEATTAEFKSARGKEAFLRDVKPLKFLSGPLDFVSIQTVSVQDEPRSEYLFRAPTGETVRIVIGRETGAWRVDRWIFQ